MSIKFLILGGGYFGFGGGGGSANFIFMGARIFLKFAKKKGFWNPHAIRANLRIDSRESGHLSCKVII